MSLAQSTARWLEERTGAPTALRNFLSEKTPASSGWHQVFGSVALFLVLVQAFTGVLLALNYAPTPGSAYASLRYILTEVTAGRLMRDLHHWGANMLIAVVVLHMVQVFLWGSYKKPREATWMSGVLLLLVTLAYGLSGYLLPWDNQAYWGTVVTTQIAAIAPLAGPLLTRLLGSGAGVGATTLTRFYALHVLLLPPATLLLIMGHLWLVRRHGVAPAPGDQLLPAKAFHPRQTLLDTAAIFGAFVILLLTASAAHVPLERLADPADTTYVPRPAWYFLFLFQMLRFLGGPLEVLGTVVLPGAAILLLVLVPFLDRGPLVRVSRRIAAMCFVLLAGAGWGALTCAAVLGTPRKTAAASIDYAGSIDWMRVAPAQVRSRQAPRFAVEGARVFEKEHCGACHAVNGVGKQIGPALNGVSRRRSEAWIRAHFLDPEKLSPGTFMPPYALHAEDLDNLVAYLSTLPE